MGVGYTALLQLQLAMAQRTSAWHRSANCHSCSGVNGSGRSHAATHAARRARIRSGRGDWGASSVHRTQAGCAIRRWPGSFSFPCYGASWGDHDADLNQTCITCVICVCMHDIVVHVCMLLVHTDDIPHKMATMTDMWQWQDCH